MSEPVLQFREVSFAYNATPVLENVNLTVDERDFLGVVGPNGGGKTTLLKLALGILRPSQGLVTVMGQSPIAARPVVGYVPQLLEFDRDFPITVMDLVLMGRLSRRSLIGRYSQRDREAALAAMAAVEVDGLAQRPLSDLSGGQRQRVFIARALASNPQVLFLDEPTASVDSRVEQDIYELLRELNKTLTVVLVTHDFGFVSSYVNKVACVNRRLVVHSAAEITKEAVFDIYNRSVQMLQHRCEI